MKFQLACISFCLFLLGTPSQALMFLRGNLLMSATQYSMALRTNSALLFGGDAFALGIFGQYEAPHSYVRDDMYGLSIRSGSNWFFELGGGPYRKVFDNVSGTGYGGYFLVGKQLGQYVQVSVLTVSKDISSGNLESRNITEFYPSIGITWGK